LDRRLEGFGTPDSEEGPALVGVLDRLRSALLTARRDLAQREEEAQEQSRAARQARQRRDELASELREHIVSLRVIVEKIHDRPGSVGALLGMTGHTSRDPVVLAAQALRVRNCLKSWEALIEGPLWGDKKIRGIELDSQGWREILGTATTALETAVTEVGFAKAREMAAVSRRRKAVVAFDELFLPASRWIAALGDLAGVPALASPVSLATAPRRSRPMSVPPEALPVNLVASSEPDRASHASTTAS